jgi:hypothetical protein
MAVLLGSVANFTVFRQKWPKIWHSSPKCLHNMAEFGITPEDGCPSVKEGRTSTKTHYRREPCFNIAVACSSTASVIRRPDSMRASSVARSRSVARYCTEVKVRPARSTFSTE